MLLEITNFIFNFRFYKTVDCDDDGRSRLHDTKDNDTGKMREVSPSH